MSAKPKNQHWVPRFYLNYFATPESIDSKDPQVWFFFKRPEDGPPVCTNVRNVAARRHLYTPVITGGIRDWAIEVRLAKLESTLAPLWRDLATNFVDLGCESVRKGLSLFTAALMLRHPASLRMTGSIHEQLIAFYETLPRDSHGVPMIASVEHRGKVHRVDPSGE